MPERECCKNRLNYWTRTRSYCLHARMQATLVVVDLLIELLDSMAIAATLPKHELAGAVGDFDGSNAPVP